MHNIKYRAWKKGFPPQVTKLEIPGWSGEKNYDYGQPWHCKPFTASATYGLELLYPFDTEVSVTCEDGICQFHYKDDSEWKAMGLDSLPFKHFTKNHFGFTSSLDIKTEPGFSVLIQPHPRYFTDMTGTVPLPSCGLIESAWWPKVFFIAFRAPIQGQYTFRKGEGFAQLLIVPTEVEYSIQPMNSAETRERELTNHLMEKVSPTVTKYWEDQKGNRYTNLYKVLSLICKKEGAEAVLKYLEKTASALEYNKRSKQRLLSRRIFHPNANTNRQPNG